MGATTFSIVACDLVRREWGVAVQSKFLAIGAVTPWLRAEVGAVATQSWINVDYGPEGLEWLADGLAASEVVARLTGADEGRDRRQLGIVDATGRAATFTGPDCAEWAGGRVGAGYAAQGNMLVSGATVDALAHAFEQSSGRPLAERLLGALAAGQRAGGDRRGQQAAALRVARRGGGYGGSEIAVDLRVDDHPEPICELERLYELHQLYFGQTPRHAWVTATSELLGRVRARLHTLGYDSGNLQADLEAWAGYENLEERVDGVERFDPVVLSELLDRS